MHGWLTVLNEKLIRYSLKCKPFHLLQPEIAHYHRNLSRLTWKSILVFACTLDFTGRQGGGQFSNLNISILMWYVSTSFKLKIWKFGILSFIFIKTFHEIKAGTTIWLTVLNEKLIRYSLKCKPFHLLQPEIAHYHRNLSRLTWKSILVFACTLDFTGRQGGGQFSNLNISILMWYVSTSFKLKIWKFGILSFIFIKTFHEIKAGTTISTLCCTGNT